MDIEARVGTARAGWNHGDLEGYLTLYDDDVQLHVDSPTPSDKTLVARSYRLVWEPLTERGQSALRFHQVLVDGERLLPRAHAGFFTMHVEIGAIT